MDHPQTPANPVPGETARLQARYDTDPAALAWARAKIQHQLDRLAKFEEQATETGKSDVAAGLSLARRSTAQLLLGGEGCVIGAFDERRPQMFDPPQAADEASAGDTLPEWLCQRFGGLTPALRTRSFWAQEAAAVRRAVARGGFKAPAGVEL